MIHNRSVSNKTHLRVRKRAETRPIPDAPSALSKPQDTSDSAASGNGKTDDSPSPNNKPSETVSVTPPVASQPTKTQPTPVAQPTSQKLVTASEPGKSAAPASANGSNAVQTKAPVPQPSSSAPNPTSSPASPTQTTVSVPSSNPAGGAARNKAASSVSSVKGSHSAPVQSFSTAMPNSTLSNNAGHFDETNGDNASGSAARASNTAHIAIIITIGALAFLALFFVVPFVRHKLKQRSSGNLFGESEKDYVNEFQIDLKQSSSSAADAQKVMVMSPETMVELPKHRPSHPSPTEPHDEHFYGSQKLNPLFHPGHPSHQQVSPYPMPTSGHWPYNPNSQSHPHDILHPVDDRDGVARYDAYGYPLGALPPRAPSSATTSFALDPAEHQYLQAYQQMAVGYEDPKPNATRRTSVLPSILFQHQNHHAHPALQKPRVMEEADDGAVIDSIVYEGPRRSDPLDFVGGSKRTGGTTVDAMFGSIPLGPRASSVYSSQTMGVAVGGGGEHVMKHDQSSAPPMPSLVDVQLD